MYSNLFLFSLVKAFQMKSLSLILNVAAEKASRGHATTKEMIFGFAID